MAPPAGRDRVRYARPRVPHHCSHDQCRMVEHRTLLRDQEDRPDWQVGQARDAARIYFHQFRQVHPKTGHGCAPTRAAPTEAVPIGADHVSEPPAPSVADIGSEEAEPPAPVSLADDGAPERECLAPARRLLQGGTRHPCPVILWEAGMPPPTLEAPALELKSSRPSSASPQPRGVRRDQSGVHSPRASPIPSYPRAGSRRLGSRNDRRRLCGVGKVSGWRPIGRIRTAPG